nr:AMP-binding protein [Streptomyces malaysiensis]
MLLALRGVILGGERCDPRTLCGWVARRGHGRPRLSNVYSITETTVHVTRHPLEPADLDGPPGSPIGVRIPDLCTYVLDERMNPVPEGIPGELYVGGPGVTRGYLGRPALAAWRFLPDPYAGSPGARLCRTGDLVRRRPGGRLEFLGRVDDQVMIRGHRAEPGEAEGALRAQPGVRTCAVVPYEDVADRCALAAHIGPAGEDPPGPRDRAASSQGGCPAAWSRVRASSSAGCPAPPTARWTVRPCPSRRWPPHRPTRPAAVRRPPSRTSGPMCSASTRSVSTTTSSTSAVTRCWPCGSPTGSGMNVASRSPSAGASSIRRSRSSVG